MEKRVTGPNLWNLQCISLRKFSHAASKKKEGRKNSSELQCTLRLTYGFLTQKKSRKKHWPEHTETNLLGCSPRLLLHPFSVPPFCVFFLIILSFMYLLIKNRNPSEIPSALIKKEVPVFETSSLIKDKDFISKNEFGNQTILVNFFASWCEPCRIEHFYINKLSKKGIKIIGIKNSIIIVSLL